MFDFKDNYFVPLNGNLDTIQRHCRIIEDSAESIIDCPQAAFDMPHVIAEANNIIKTAQNIITLAKRRQKHPEVEADFEGIDLWKRDD